MSETVTVPTIQASVWLPDEDGDGEEVLGRVGVESTDDNEISLEVRATANGETEDVATVYLTDAEATRLAFALGALVLRG